MVNEYQEELAKELAGEAIEEAKEEERCDICGSRGFYAVDTMVEGEHSQFNQKCECQLK